MFSRNNDIKNLGTILGIWAHPDDETWTSGGIMAQAYDNGQRVFCITATKGEQGVRDESKWPKNKIAEIRSSELKEALKQIGSIGHFWLGYSDGECSQANVESAVKRLSQKIETIKPDTILTFGPEGLTGHPDHKTVSKWVKLACAEQKVKVFHAVESRKRYRSFMKEFDAKLDIYFNIDQPPLCKESNLDLCFKLKANILRKKISALRIQKSQTTKMFEKLSSNEIEHLASKECFVLSK